ncbi:MAG: hypothetical protein A2Z34_04300 [Planctomycetes bacterium RBG_16_59_8]|nr:MAG: hypothetical protein A2Z34_04300 [Planctomycetes bacterium RBG_16_59_8]
MSARIGIFPGIRVGCNISPVPTYCLSMTRRLLRTLVLAIGLLAPSFLAFPQDAKENPATGTVAIAGTGDYVFFEVTVNAHKLWAVLDTAADYTYFDGETAKSAGVQGAGDVTIPMEVGGLSVRLPAKIRDLRKLLFPNQQAALQGGRVMLILGHNVVEQFLTVVDYRKKKVAFIRAKHPIGDEEFKTLTAPYVGDATECRTLNLDIVDNHPFITGNVKGRSERFHFCVDTGGPGDVNFLTIVGKEIFNVETEVTVEIAADGHTFPGVRMVKCPPCYVDQNSQKMQKRDNKLYVGLLGHAFLHPYTVVFDYSRKKLLLAK